ncbi:MAG: SGNH/GDSL hydrolase family protein [Clostridia bacterium]|nr:SGNH/GDSL hydrolase family protein [Clostridia bacterium]
MKRKLTKLLCAALTLIMIVPLIGAPAFAADAEVNTVYFNDFEDKTFDTDLDGDGTDDAYLMVNGDDTFRDLNGVLDSDFNYVMGDPTNEGNDLWRVPMATTKAQNGHRIDGIKPSYAGYTNVVFENDIYIPVGTTGWARWRIYGHTGGWNPESNPSAWRSFKTFYDINLASGELLLFADNSKKATLSQGEWYTIGFCVNMASGAVELYINDVLALSGDLGITDLCIEGFWNGMVDVAGKGYYYCDNINVFEGTASPEQGEPSTGIFSADFNGNTFDTDLDGDGTNDAYKIVDSESGFRYDDDEGLNTHIDNKESTNYHYVMSAPDSGDAANGAWRIPMSADNYDNWGQIIPAMTSAAHQHSEIVVEMDLYVPEGITSCTARWRSFGGRNPEGELGGYHVFMDLDLASATLRLGEDSYALSKETWYTVSLCLNFESGAVNIYVNGAPALTHDVGDNLLIGHFWFAMTDDYGSPDHYLWVDNINIFAGNAPSKDGSENGTVCVTLNGEELELYKGASLTLKESDKELLYARIEEGDTVTYTQEVIIQPRDGMIITTCSVELDTLSDAAVRLCSPTGIRYISTVSQADMNALAEDAHISELRIGTLIAPSLYYGLMPDAFTKAAISEFKTLDVPATVGQWYPDYEKAGCYTFAGSITNILEENINLPFSGIGYLEAVMDNGEILTVYGADGWETAPSLTYAQGAVNILEDTDMELSEGEKAYFQAYADKKTDDLMEQFRKDLEGLHVLAIGDSTIAGEVPRWEYQWQNWMASDCNWAYTNLAEGGASLSYIEGQYQKSLSLCMKERPEYKYGVPTDDDNWYYSTDSAVGKGADDVELIIVSGGFNDFGGDTIYAKLGDMSLENKDTTTYLGSWNYMLEELQTRYKNAKIVIINQWYLPTTWVANARGDNMTCYEFTNSIATLYEKFYKNNDRIYLIDAGDPEVSGVNMMDAEFRAEYARKPGDCFHLNAKGMELMKAAMYPYIWSIMAKDLK